MRSYIIASSFVLVIGSAYSQDGIVTHHLRIAASSALPLTNADADAIISKMNATIATQAYSWSVPCPGVQFVRDGDVFHSPSLSTTGTYESLSAELRGISPQSNVFVVSYLTCEQVNAAGCGPIGLEPAIVGAYWPDYDYQIWLHERGHNVGLSHSAEAPLDDTQQPPEIALRIMFWQIGDGHNGLTQDECNHFESPSLASISPNTAVVAAAPPGRQLGPGAQIATAVSAAVPPVAVPEHPAALPVTGNTIAQTAASPPTPASDEVIYAELRKKRAQEAASLGLTTKAFEVIGHPWERAPIEKVKALGAEDIESIRNLLKGAPNQYTAQAIAVLGQIGTEADVALIAGTLNRPAAAAPPGPLSTETRQQIRFDLSAKNASAGALGLLAKRIKSDAAVEALTANVDINQTAKSVGASNAQQLSINSLSALSSIPNSAAQAAVDAALQASRNAGAGPTGIDRKTATIKFDGKTAKVPLLNVIELQALRKSSDSTESIPHF